MHIQWAEVMRTSDWVLAPKWDICITFSKGSEHILEEVERLGAGV